MAGEISLERRTDIFIVSDVCQLKHDLEAGRLSYATNTVQSHLCRVRCGRTGRTALHVAADAGYVHVVDLLVKFMSAEQLEVRDNEGFTALARVTCNGNRRLVECMIGKSGKLTTIQNDKGNIPAVAALYDGNLELARYLYSRTPPDILRPENDIIGPTVVCEAIYNNALGKN